MKIIDNFCKNSLLFVMLYVVVFHCSLFTHKKSLISNINQSIFATKWNLHTNQKKKDKNLKFQHSHKAKRNEKKCLNAHLSALETLCDDIPLKNDGSLWVEKKKIFIIK